MLYNKDLGITETDVAQENNLGILSYWRKSLELQIKSIKELSKETGEITPAARKSLFFKKMFLRLIQSRLQFCLGEERQASGWTPSEEWTQERTLDFFFRWIAKQELPPQEYERILNLAAAKTIDDLPGMKTEKARIALMENPVAPPDDKEISIEQISLKDNFSMDD